MLNTPLLPRVYSTDRSKAVVPCSCVLSPLSISITSRGEESANLSVLLFLFVCFYVFFVRLFDLRLFWFCLFPLPLGVWEGLRLLIVALPGLFSYLFMVLRLNILIATP